MEKYLARVREIKYLTLTTVEFVVDLVAPDTINFIAGQKMNFLFGQSEISFFILSVPDHNQSLSFCIDFSDPKVAGYLKSLRQGADIYLNGPVGEFTFKNFQKNSLFIATGTGVSAFASIIPDALSRGFKEQSQLIFGLKSEEDVFYFDRFTHLTSLYPNFKFTPILSQPQSHWPGEIGRPFTYVSILYEKFIGYDIYLSGENKIMNELKGFFAAKNHNLGNVYMELID